MLYTVRIAALRASVHRPSAAVSAADDPWRTGWYRTARRAGARGRQAGAPTPPRRTMTRVQSSSAHLRLHKHRRSQQDGLGAVKWAPSPFRRVACRLRIQHGPTGSSDPRPVADAAGEQDRGVFAMDSTLPNGRDGLVHQAPARRASPPAARVPPLVSSCAPWIRVGHGGGWPGHRPQPEVGEQVASVAGGPGRHPRPGGSQGALPNRSSDRGPVLRRRLPPGGSHGGHACLSARNGPARPWSVRPAGLLKVRDG
jgi:hypothetical protein